MQTLYYMIVDGRQAGPFTKEALRMEGVTPDTFVWREGLEGWVKASSLPELGDVLYSDSAFGGYAQAPTYDSAPQAPAYAPGMMPPGSPVKPHTNWMPWAIVVTVAGFLCSCIGIVFGIIGIVQANKANTFYSRGMEVEGDRANATARTMTIIGIVLCVIGAIGSVVLVSTGYMNTLMHNL
ncbi:MAG: DUF4339 domain-containing protein [Candidatus Amulumruptor caecigallinarius]|nr:DUF4339 domain-containing protein [Candidatus Amulumruptor caecigallinarius]